MKHGRRKQLCAQWTTLRLSAAGLGRLNRKLREIDELLQEEQRTGKGRFYCYTSVLSPVDTGSAETR